MIKVSQLNYTYEKTGKQAIKGIDFHIEKGEIFGFLGPSGAGKTTTQRLLIGLLRGYQGSVKIMDKERADWDRNFFEHVGVAFDFPNLYLKLTAKENLELISAYYKSRPRSIDELLDKVGLLPDKNKKIESYSKGMKMRLNFVRALMHDPDILFFDEPTSGLDPVNAKIIKNTILDLKASGKTVFMTTHNMTVAEQLCDRVAFINDGTLSAIDSPANLMRAYGKPFVHITYLDGGMSKELQVPVRELKTNSQFLRILEEDKLQSIHSQEATLEDVFIHLTGRELI